MFGSFLAQQDPFGSHSSFLRRLWSRCPGPAGISELIRAIPTPPEDKRDSGALNEEKQVQKWIFPEDPPASTLGKPSGGVGDASHGLKDIGNHGTEQIGH